MLSVVRRWPSHITDLPDSLDQQRRHRRKNRRGQLRFPRSLPKDHEHQRHIRWLGLDTISSFAEEGTRRSDR